MACYDRKDTETSTPLPLSNLPMKGVNPPIYYSARKNSEKVLNEFFQIGSKQIKTGLVNWSKKIKSKTHFEAITTRPLCISAARHNKEESNSGSIGRKKII